MLNDLFYTINFIVSIVISLVGLLAGASMILIVLFNRRCQTILNLLKCNTILTMIIYSFFVLLSSILGMNKNWSNFEPVCRVRAFCFNTICAIICYSFAIQAISRLFYAVLYRHRYLITWKTHWYLIICSWLICTVIQFIMYLINNDLLSYEEPSRWCLVSTQKPIVSLCAIFVAMLIPVNIILIIYSIIFYRIRQSTRRVRAFTTQAISSQTNSPLNVKREIKVMKNMILVIFLMFCSGILYISLLIWNLGGWSSPPESLYLINLNVMAFGVTLLIVLTVSMNKEVKTVIFHYMRRCHERY